MVGTSPKQIKPKIYINNCLVDAVEIGGSFTYLGRSFDYGMTNANHKVSVRDKFTSIMEIINNLPLHPKNKMKIYHRYLLPKLSWDLTVSDLGITWVKQNLDNRAAQYFRRWLELPISCNLSIAQLTKQEFGLGLVLVSVRYTQCQATLRNILRNSKNADINHIHEETAAANIQYDIYKSSKDAIKTLRSLNKDRIENKLTSQKLIISSVWQFSSPKLSKYWSKVVESMPRNIYNFCIRYLNNALPNGTNAFRWKTREDSFCTQCQQAESLQHVVSGCPSALREGRYNWRHDSILLAMASAFSSVAGSKVYCDIATHFLKPEVITGTTSRPDLVVEANDKLLVVELTAGFETNISKNELRKQNRYEDLLHNLKEDYTSVQFCNISMGALGVFGRDSECLISRFAEFG